MQNLEKSIYTRAVSWLFAVFTLLACVALAENLLLSPATPATPELIDLNDIPLELAKWGPENRLAHKFPPGEAVVVNLGPASHGQYVRLGLLDRGWPNKHARASIRVGERHVKTVSSAGAQWVNFRVPVPRGAQGECQIIFSSREPFWVSPIELTPREAPLPNVLIYLVDTLRRDHLNVYGYPRETAPTVAALARDGVVFEQAIAQSSWTRPSVASLLTGTYPNTHGGQDRGDILRPGLPSLACALQEAGHETHAIMSNPSCLSGWGFGEGFWRFLDIDAMTLEADKDTRVVDAAIDVLRHAAGRPWFLYVHTIAPHAPYEPPAPFDTRFTQTPPNGEALTDAQRAILNAYDGEIAYNDAQFARLVDTLKSLRLYDHTLIIAISDHGEEFGEHGGDGHGHTLYDEVIRVPLIIKFPDSAHAGERYTPVMELVDIAPTILECLGLSIPAGIEGQAVWSRLDSAHGADDADRIAYASLALERRNIRAARAASAKYIHDVAAATEMWFDLLEDPLERAPSYTQPAHLAALRGHAARMAATNAPGLHILLTGPLASGSVIEGHVTGEDLGAPTLRYSACNGEAVNDAAGVAFRVIFSPSDALPPDFRMWSEMGAVQNHAHIHIPLLTDSAASLTCTLTLDGAAMPAGQIYLGAAERNATLRETPLPLSDLLAPPDTFVPENLPERIAAYLWYAPPAGYIGDENLDPAMAEALRALGYIN